jgi:hypothetical protein
VYIDLYANYAFIHNEFGDSSLMISEYNRFDDQMLIGSLNAWIIQFFWDLSSGSRAVNAVNRAVC